MAEMGRRRRRRMMMGRDRRPIREVELRKTILSNEGCVFVVVVVLDQQRY